MDTFHKKLTRPNLILIHLKTTESTGIIVDNYINFPFIFVKLKLFFTYLSLSPWNDAKQNRMVHKYCNIYYLIVLVELQIFYGKIFTKIACKAANCHFIALSLQ